MEARLMCNQLQWPDNQHRAVGRTPASYGRKEKVQEDRRKQMVLEDEDNDEGIF